MDTSHKLDASRLAVVLSFFYAYILAFVLPIAAFKDRENYLVYAADAGSAMARYFDAGILAFLVNEPVFLLANYVLSLFMGPESVLSLLIFSFAFLFAYSMLGFNRKLIFLLLIALLLPQILKNHVVQLRQGYAVAIFTYAWLYLGRSKKWFMIGLTPFIHASFFIVGCFLVVFWFSSWARMKFDLKATVFFAISVFSVFLIFFVADLFGSRHALRYSGFDLNVSGSAFLFWSLVFAIFCFQSREWYAKHSFAALFVLVYLGMYFTFPLSGRVFESVLPIVLIAGFSTRGYYRYAFIGLFLMYSLIQIYIGLGQPLLGFASQSWEGALL
ncbi:hypothetical protein [Marinobacter similis]|uniref:EpsG family protein n=1 Tax=Marinobacter similis TaxID=1420916 RepID=W5YM75_9GAMM|nr:hypothetical protein [Marinobacter similis]AHI30140.1 hypothetical protein AU14_12745 [Marinobacter similis]